jgi:chromosome segregation ATPase
MTRNPSQPLALAAALIAAAGLTACSSAYYSTWEMLGKEKRDLLRSNVEAVQDEQRDAADGFEDALDRLRGLYQVDAGDLEKVYDKLKDDLEEAEDRAGDIHDRIDKIDSIATDLFDEWETEIDEISTASYRAKSREKLTETRGKYAALAASLKKSEASMEPVLTQLKDNVLYLKHNLNAAAIGGLGAEVENIEADIEALLADMRASIAEADRFLTTLPE